jgi:hypothetical protein
VSKSKRYTEGICQDGAAILDNGEMVTITEILDRLNSSAKLEKELEEARRLSGLEKDWNHNNAGVIESFSKVLEKRNKTLDEFKKYVQFFCDDGDTALMKGGNYRSIIIGYQSLFREILGELDKPSKGGER